MSKAKPRNKAQEIIAALRKQGWSHEKIARSLVPPVAMNTVRLWEQGRYNPYPNNMDALEKTLQGANSRPVSD